MAEIRYYLDEHVAVPVAKGLRRRTVDVLTVSEARMRGEGDPDQLALAFRMGRVFFTHDADFLRLLAEAPPHAGVVFSPRQRAAGDIIRALHLIHQVLTAEEMSGRLEFI